MVPQGLPSTPSTRFCSFRARIARPLARLIRTIRILRPKWPNVKHFRADARKLLKLIFWRFYSEKLKKPLLGQRRGGNRGATLSDTFPCSFKMLLSTQAGTTYCVLNQPALPTICGHLPTIRGTIYPPPTRTNFDPVALLHMAYPWGYLESRRVCDIFVLCELLAMLTIRGVAVGSL